MALVLRKSSVAALLCLQLPDAGRSRIRADCCLSSAFRDFAIRYQLRVLICRLFMPSPRLKLLRDRLRDYLCRIKLCLATSARPHILGLLLHSLSRRLQRSIAWPTHSSHCLNAGENNVSSGCRKGTVRVSVILGGEVFLTLDHPCRTLLPYDSSLVATAAAAAVFSLSLLLHPAFSARWPSPTAVLFVSSTASHDARVGIDRSRASENREAHCAASSVVLRLSSCFKRGLKLDE